MSNESVEAQLARWDERWNSVLKELEASANGRKNQYETNERMERSIFSIESKLASVEKQVASAQPTIEEFITIKHKVVGAGWAGKMLWAGGAFLIGLIAASREAIFTWLKG